MQLLNATEKMQAKWLLKSYFKNGVYSEAYEKLNLEIDENRLHARNILHDKIWPEESYYEKISVMSGNYYHRSDGLIFEVKFSNENELHLDILEKDVINDQVNSHLFYFDRLNEEVDNLKT